MWPEMYLTQVLVLSVINKAMVRVKVRVRVVADFELYKQ